MNNKPKILIVEDDKYWIESHRKALKNYPIVIHEAMQAKEGIALLQKSAYAATFVDLEITGQKDGTFGGFEVLDAAKSINPYTETIVITGHKEEEILNQLSKHQVSLCIKKPVNFRELQFSTDLVVQAWNRRFDALLNALNSFPTYALLMENRKHNRPALKMTNEYDVQDLLHVILKPFYPDIEPEEYTPKRAGSSKRIDFVIKGLETVIEIKMIRNITHAKSVARELDIDIRSYPSHPDCKLLVCFVYDPKHLITDHRKLERDLSGETTQKGKTIDVIVQVRPG